MDGHNDPVRYTNQSIPRDRHTCPDGYPDHDIHTRAKRDQHACAELDPAPDRYPLGHLDGEPYADRHIHPDAHPNSSGNLHTRTHPYASPDGYQVALSIAHQYQISHARNHLRSQPCL